MRSKHLVAILVLLMLAVPATPAHAGGIVSVCDEAHLLAALAGGGTVTFSCSGTIILTAEIVIAADTTIDGSGQTVTVSGNHAVRVFTVNDGVTLNLNGLTIADGSISDFGGGIFNRYGTLSVSNSTFSGNSAIYGGGIYNSSGPMTVSNSTFSGNSVVAGGGIYIHDSGPMTVSNSTFSGNSADSFGGGIFTINSNTLVSNSTFTDNSASTGGGILSSSALTVSNSTFSGNSAIYGGGIYNSRSGPVMLENAIVANSPMGGNCSGATTDGGGNLSYPDATCPGINSDPLLGPLQNNGGPTQTMAPGIGSAAIDAGSDAICAAPPVNNLDQRGVTRPQGTHCDIGAVEQILEPAAVSVSALNAQSQPGAITPAMVAGLLLVALVAVGFRRRPRHIG